MNMFLNTMTPGEGARKDRKRVARGIGSGFGKTAGRGHKGQKSRAGGYHKVGFEGGQMPLHRRLPKRGFVSRLAYRNVEVRLDTLNLVPETEETVDLLSLKQYGLIPAYALAAKVILAGDLTKKVNLSGINVTKGAKAAIEKLGGTITLDKAE